MNVQFPLFGSTNRRQVFWLLLVVLLPALAPACEVQRALFTNDVMDNAPVDQVLVLDRGIGKINFFTEVRGCQGKTLVHRWEFAGKVVGQVRVKVTAAQSANSSSRDIAPDQIGKWTVMVTNEQGEPLKAAIFYHGQLPEQAPAGLPTYAVMPITGE